MKLHYFYQRLPGLPYSIAVAFPKEHYKIFEVKNDNQFNFSQSIFATDDSWKIHPKWNYCKFNYKRESNPEENLKFFLKKMSDEQDEFVFQHK